MSAASSSALGIVRLEDVVFYVHNIARSHRFYCDRIDFAWVAQSDDEHADRVGQLERVYEAGDVRMTVVQPMRPQSPAGRYLKRHPDGIAKLVFEVADIQQTFATLNQRGATMVDDIQWCAVGDGRQGRFDITTPFGEAQFQFVQHDGDGGGLPPHLQRLPPGKKTRNRFGLHAYDHITSNFLTLGPMVLWCKEVLGLEEYWRIQFHTDDVAPQGEHGSGLKSVVLWDPHSGVKFANNEPMRPHFQSSQIYSFVVDNHGPGIQHAAISTRDIISTVTGLRECGVAFMDTPDTYYDLMPQRLIDSGVNSIDEDIEALRKLGILVDGKADRQYLLQIFLQEAAGLYRDEEAGPFFFEIIQRKGDRGFGGGNFRALFESIELAEKQRHQAQA